MPVHSSTSRPVLRRTRPVRHSNRALVLVAVAALGALLLRSAGGLMVYSNAQQMMATSAWIDRSQRILTHLQMDSRNLDRIDSSSRLYLLTKDSGYLRSAQSSALELSGGMGELRRLVSGDASQLGHAQHLQACIERLVNVVDSLPRQSVEPTPQVLACGQQVSLMQQEQQNLLGQRQAEVAPRSFRWLALEIAYVAISLLLVLALLGFLTWGILRRRRFEDTLSEANARLESAVHELRVRAEESELLTAARDELQLCVDPAQAYQCATSYCERLLPGTSGALLVINNSRQTVELAASWNSPPALLDSFPLDSCCGLRSGRRRWRRPGQFDVDCGHFLGRAPDSYLCVPLSAHSDTLGFVYIECPTAEVLHAVGVREKPLLELLEFASMSIAGLNLRMRLENQSIRDSLTGLFNRHFMQIALDRELRRAARQQSSLAVLMLDIDHFKQFNDTCGHEAGDAILREVGETFRQAVRAEDIVCRYGGEEFVIILPEISTEAALHCAETLRGKISEIRMRPPGDGLREITVSIGVAMYPQSAEELDQILRAADRALYEAKHRGRNTVVLAEAEVTLSETKTRADALRIGCEAG